MKRFIVFTVGMLVWGNASAQQPVSAKAPATVPQKAGAMSKNAVGGYIRDSRFRPIEGVEAFIYPGDSANSIIASGYSDATGRYETNSVMPGKYNVRFFYPSTNKAILVTGVVMKRGVTDITLRNEPPVADTSINFLFFQPKPAPKVKAKAN